MTPMTPLEDRLALRALGDEYAFAVDERDVDRFTQVFTDDGELAIFEPADAEPARVYRGREELQTILELVAVFSATFHLMANHACRVDGDRAEGVTYCLAHHLTEPADAPAHDTVMLIRYEDRYVRVADGWRFARRNVMRQWTEHHAADRAPMFPPVRP